ncbi:hypothetical protein HPB52_022240 [Rhipicephalus sanguineus]|uniref:Uncharacterized protein n=1 Tax=Rhipicephalus sanguineus TaxID=34632 RepID=A0A9D4TBS6_RHISA|nr:hypothetical protein HPB52_022240 [Rhipicephalus sanguineus]
MSTIRKTTKLLCPLQARWTHSKRYRAHKISARRQLKLAVFLNERGCRGLGKLAETAAHYLEAQGLNNLGKTKEDKEPEKFAVKSRGGQEEETCPYDPGTGGKASCRMTIVSGLRAFETEGVSPSSTYIEANDEKNTKSQMNRMPTADDVLDGEGAEVNLSSPFLAGRVTVICMENTLFDVVVGSVEDVRYTSAPDPHWKRPSDSLETKSTLQRNEVAVRHNQPHSMLDGICDAAAKNSSNETAVAVAIRTASQTSNPTG